MPYRPESRFRTNIQGIILPLTAAIGRLYGTRNTDDAYPLGAFYTEHISSRVWSPAGGIWFFPISLEKIQTRRISDERIQRFMRSILVGDGLQLRNGLLVSWEIVEDEYAQQLPPPQL